MTLSPREASGQGLCICVSVGIMFYSYVCESINLFVTLSSGKASGQGFVCVCFSGYNVYWHVCEGINLFMILSSREASGQGVYIYIVFLSGYEFILMGRP